MTMPAPDPALPDPPGGRLDMALFSPDSVLAVAARPNWWRRIRVTKIALFVTSLFLFVLAISLMKEGARALAPLIQNVLSIDSPANCLGFGWLFAYTIMSGSPVAAAALTFFDAGMLSRLGAYAMITGSRLGAGFLVLLIGFLYVLRGRNRATSLNMGLLSLTVTASTYLPSLALGMFLLRAGTLDSIRPPSGALLRSMVDILVDPMVRLAVDLLPNWAVFGLGLGIILLSFHLFDRCLPQMALKESQVGRVSSLVYRPAVMFVLGALVTLISMSVSLSLSILVPLSNRGFIRRENVIPYIMGANITTFVDTLFAAVLLNNLSAFAIVNVAMISTTVVSVLVLALAYQPYQRIMLALVNWITASDRNLALFIAAIFMVPIVLVVV